MIIPFNPFVRGYRNFDIRRVLMITYEDDCSPCYRPLHASQNHLQDDELDMRPCIFSNEFALVANGHAVPPELHGQCPGHGTVRDILYQITANDFGAPLHVGDVYSADDANQVVRCLRFEASQISRCWEISAKHVSRKSGRYLEERARTGTPSRLLFEVFSVPPGGAFGCRLFGTPWTTELLEAVEGKSSQQLRHEQLLAGVPDSLVHVLHLASVADTRMLIFDPDADALTGLPMHPDWGILPSGSTPEQTVHVSLHLQPIRQLECPTCGDVTQGRPWWKRETGYGICTPCAELLRRRGTSPAEMTLAYGYEGIHYNSITDVPRA